MKNNIITIVGGDFDNNNGKESGIVKKMMRQFGFNGNGYINGGNLDVIKSNTVMNSISNSRLIIWMPNISNDEDKTYPKKGIGTILICSKVIRPRYTYKDAIARIFKMHGNAVIAIEKDQSGFSTFTLIDALGNYWYSGCEINELCSAIMRFYIFMSQTIHKGTIYDESLKDALNDKPALLDSFVTLNNKLADYIMASCGDRFFGNFSTRCQRLFPTQRTNNYMYVSPRNTDKERLSANDFVLYNPDSSSYVAENRANKPSVDSPVQGEIYKEFPEINYMIHGHAFITAPNDDIRVLNTDNYFPCGDMRELDELTKCISHIIKHDGKNYGVVNLAGHGFILFSQTFEQMEFMINSFTDESFRMNDGESWNDCYKEYYK